MKITTSVWLLFNTTTLSRVSGVQSIDYEIAENSACENSISYIGLATNRGELEKINESTYDFFFSADVEHCVSQPLKRRGSCGQHLEQSSGELSRYGDSGLGKVLESRLDKIRNSSYF